MSFEYARQPSHFSITPIPTYSIMLTKNLQIYTFSRKNHREGNTSPHSSPVQRHLPRHLPPLVTFPATTNPLFAPHCGLSTQSTVPPDKPCLLAIFSGDRSFSPDKASNTMDRTRVCRGRQPIIDQHHKQTHGAKTNTMSLLIQLIINTLSATPPLAISIPHHALLYCRLTQSQRNLSGMEYSLRSTVMMSSFRSLRMAALTTLAVES